jgi:hypothetical protein
MRQWRLWLQASLVLRCEWGGGEAWRGVSVCVCVCACVRVVKNIIDFDLNERRIRDTRSRTRRHARQCGMSQG